MARKTIAPGRPSFFGCETRSVTGDDAMPCVTPETEIEDTPTTEISRGPLQTSPETLNI